MFYDITNWGLSSRFSEILKHQKRAVQMLSGKYF